MVRLVGLPQQQCIGAVVRDAARQLVLEEVRVTGGHDRVAHVQASVAVVGMEPVTLPRVVGEDDIGPDRAHGEGHPLGDLPRVGELAVNVPQERDRAGGAERRCRGTLLPLPCGHECCGVRIRVPRALGAVRADEVVHLGTCGRPFCERAAAPELDVVRVGPDRQDDSRHLAVSGPLGVRGLARHRSLSGVVRAHRAVSFMVSFLRRCSSSRSSAVSRSRARSPSSTTTNPSPRRCASTACAAKLPGP